MNELGVGVVGAGGMGSRHARNVTAIKGASLVAVMDTDHVRAGRLAAELDAKPFFDAMALIEHPDVQAVVVASPDSTHADLVMACLEAGKPVLCEKPLAATVEQAAAIVDREAATGRRMVQVGFMREYDPAHRAVREAVEGGLIGRPFLFKGLHANVSPPTPRFLAEVLVASAIHDFHSARFMTAEEIEWVVTHHLPFPFASPDTCRLAMITLGLSGGVLGTIEMNADAAHGYEVAVEVVGDGGRASTGGTLEPVLSRSGTKGQLVTDDWLARFDTAYALEMQAFVGTAPSGTVGGPSAWDGYATLAAAQAAVASGLSGLRESVDLPLRPRLYQ